MKSSRRHGSLVPLSREHHYSLMVCLRIRRGLPVHKDDEQWLKRKREQVIRFFESDLALHFKAEEAVLFPSMQDFPGASLLVDELLAEHRKIEMLVEQLRRSEGAALARALNEFADLLEAHIGKEERMLFPIYEQQASAELAQEVEKAVAGLIGTAMQPKNPDLLK